MFLILVLGLVTAAYPGSLKTGFRAWGGLIMSRYQGTPLPVGIPELHYQNAWRTGMGLGAGLELKMSGAPMSFILELSYLQKGTEMEIYYLDTRTSSYFYKLGSLSQTGLIRIGPEGKIAPYLLAGYELAFILNHRGQSFGSGLGGPDSDLRPDTKKMDFSLAARAVLEFRIQLFL